MLVSASDFTVSWLYSPQYAHSIIQQSQFCMQQTNLLFLLRFFSLFSLFSFLPHFTSSSTQPWAFPTFRGVPWLILLNRWTYRNWSQIARRCYSPSGTTPSAAASAPPTGIAHSSPSVPAGCSSSAVYSRQPIIKNPEQLLQEDSRRRRGVVLGKPHNAQNFPRKTVHREQIREEHRVDLDSKRRQLVDLLELPSNRGNGETWSMKQRQKASCHFLSSMQSRCATFG